MPALKDTWPSHQRLRCQEEEVAAGLVRSMASLNLEMAIAIRNSNSFNSSRMSVVTSALSRSATRTNTRKRVV